MKPGTRGGCRRFQRHAGRMGADPEAGIVGSSNADEEKPIGARLKALCEELRLRIVNTFVETQPTFIKFQGKARRMAYIVVSEHFRS